MNRPARRGFSRAAQNAGFRECARTSILRNGWNKGSVLQPRSGARMQPTACPELVEGAQAVGRLYTLVRWNTFFTNPPLCINEAQLREAFAIIDKGLEITDKAVRD